MPTQSENTTLILGLTFIIGCACGYFYHKEFIGCENTLTHKFEKLKKAIDKSD